MQTKIDYDSKSIKVLTKQISSGTSGVGVVGLEVTGLWLGSFVGLEVSGLWLGDTVGSDVVGLEVTGL